MSRRAELAGGLAATRARVDAACVAAGRDPSSVMVLPVTKFFPATDLAELRTLGCNDFGENRVQEAAAKADEVPAARLHMLGHIQRNKANSVARWAVRVHSLDSVRLATALNKAAATALDEGTRSSPLEVLVQISLDGDPHRGGVSIADLNELCEMAAGAAALRLKGVMGVPPLESEPEASFAEFAALWQRIVSQYPDADEFSAGMSGDLEPAVKLGSTCVRVGTAILGQRPLISHP